MDRTDQLIDELIKGKDAKQIVGEGGLLSELSKRLIERALAGELTTHLGYEKHERRTTSNARNGHFKKTIKGDQGVLEIQVPRDREGTFEPKIIKKGQTRMDGFDEKILSLYSRGMTTREIQGHLEEIYGVDISPALVSNVTNEVMAEVHEWQNRPLDAVYPVVYFDALRIKSREEGRILNKAVYLALGINMEGHKELLGLWIQNTEGAKFWLGILTELENRGLHDIFVACVDGLTGFPEAIRTVFPLARVQLCIVHMTRNSLNYVSYKERKAVADDLKPVYRAATAEQARCNLQAFATKWDKKYPTISRTWNRHWEDLSTFFDYPEDIRRILYTTNPMESVNAALRKVTKNRSVFPNDDAVRKMFYLAIQKVSKKWTMPIRNWKAALSRFVILYEDRIPF